jgi:hypothetical protein
MARSLIQCQMRAIRLSTLLLRDGYQTLQNHRPTGFNDLTLSLPAEIDTFMANGDNVGTTHRTMIEMRARHMPMFTDTTTQ